MATFNIAMTAMFNYQRVAPIQAHISPEKNSLHGLATARLQERQLLRNERSGGKVLQCRTEATLEIGAVA